MKKFLYTLFAAAAVLAAVSCEKETPVVPQEEPQSEAEPGLVNPITLTFAADACSKVSISGETAGSQTAVWDENDEIKIVWFNSGESVMKSTTATAASHGLASTTFTATVEDADFYYAVYPSTLTVALDGDGNFTVNFPNNAAASTSFASAAWYAAKTTKAAKSFAFHPISTILKFTLAGTAVAAPEKVYFRSVNGGLHKLHGHAGITFADESQYPLTAAAVDGAANVTFTVAGAGSYYVPIPAYGASETTGADGFIFQIQKSGETIPAAYYAGTLTQTPGKLYIISNPVDTKVIRSYYVARETKGTGGGLTEANAETLANLKANVPAFKYSDNIAGAFLLDGVTVNFLGDADPYTEPLAPFNTNSSANVHSYTIVGGVGGGTTTFTTTATSAFGAPKANVTLQNITFNGCSGASALTVTSGKVSVENCTFSDNSAANGGALTIGGASATDESLRASFRNTVFLNNSVSGSGGVLLVPDAARNGVVMFDNCRFDTNTAKTGTNGAGGVVYTANGTTAVLFNNCSFTGIDAKKNGIIVYMNNANARLGMNNCTVNGGSATTGKSNGALITNKGKTVIANSTFWSKDGYGAWGLIALGAASAANESSIVNCLVRNGTATGNTNLYPAFYLHANYYQNIQYCVFTGNSTATAEKHTIANSWDLGVAQGQLITDATYKSKAMSGVTQQYYDWTNDLAEAGFTKPSKTQISNIIAKTAESADDAKDGFGKLFLDWLEEVDGLTADIKGTARPEAGFKPGSAE